MLALKALCDALLLAVDAGGEQGVNGGLLYAVLMGQGCGLDEFQRLVSGMVGAGLLCKVRECYHLGEFGLSLVDGLKGGAVA
jgi:hypothetical protein